LSSPTNGSNIFVPLLKTQDELAKLATRAKLGEFILSVLMRFYLQQCVDAIGKSTFDNKPSGGSYRKRHCHKPWFDVNYHTTKRELKL
jgi:hypothetical protein